MATKAAEVEIVFARPFLRFSCDLRGRGRGGCGSQRCTPRPRRDTAFYNDGNHEVLGDEENYDDWKDWLRKDDARAAA